MIQGKASTYEEMAHPTLPTDLLYPIITIVFDIWLDDYLTGQSPPWSDEQEVCIALLRSYVLARGSVLAIT